MILAENNSVNVGNDDSSTELPHWIRQYVEADLLELSQAQSEGEQSTGDQDVLYNMNMGRSAGLRRGHWTAEEHKTFLEAVLVDGKNWSKVRVHLTTRTVEQVRSHAQKYFRCLQRRKTAKDEGTQLSGPLFGLTRRKRSCRSSPDVNRDFVANNRGIFPQLLSYKVNDVSTDSCSSTAAPSPTSLLDQGSCFSSSDLPDSPAIYQESERSREHLLRAQALQCLANKAVQSLSLEVLESLPLETQHRVIAAAAVLAQVSAGAPVQGSSGSDCGSVGGRRSKRSRLNPTDTSAAAQYDVQEHDDMHPVQSLHSDPSCFGGYGAPGWHAGVSIISPQPAQVMPQVDMQGFSMTTPICADFY